MNIAAVETGGWKEYNKKKNAEKIMGRFMKYSELKKLKRELVKEFYT